MSDMSLPLKYSDDIALVWIDLSFTDSTIMDLKSTTLLSNLSGYFSFGTLNALMGPSNSGKSLFLKCLSGQIDRDFSPETEIYLNRAKSVRPCFIRQNVGDHLLPGLTAGQLLLYASKLKNSEEDFSVDHQNNIQKLMKDLMIGDTAHTRVDKCSGGEQKRIAIAAELTAIKMPNLLCIDEPTSGLDSNAAEIVMKCLKVLSKKHNMAIVTSIHQPNADLLLTFDQLYVLSRGGKCVFAGAATYLGEHLRNSSIQCKACEIPIEVLIKYSAKGLKDENVKELVNKNFDQNKRVIEKFQSECQLSPNGIQQTPKPFRLSNFANLFSRSLVNTVKLQWKGMIIQSIILANIGTILAFLGNRNIGKIDGCVATELAANTNRTAGSVCANYVEALTLESMINQNLSFLFTLVSMSGFLQIVVTTLSFAPEIKVFFAERLNGWYSTSAYYFAKSLVELPLPVMTTIAFVYFGYAASNQIDSGFRLAGVTYFVVAALLCCQGIGFLACIVFDRNSQLAITAATLTFCLFMFMCDFLVPVGEMNAALRLISEASFLKQALHGSIIYVYGFGRCPSGTVSWALQQFDGDLVDDERRKLWMKYGLIGVAIIAFRVITLAVLVIKVRSKERRNKRRSEQIVGADKIADLEEW